MKADFVLSYAKTTEHVLRGPGGTPVTTNKCHYYFKNNALKHKA